MAIAVMNVRNTCGYWKCLFILLSIPSGVCGQVSIQQGVVVIGSQTSQISINTSLFNHGNLIQQGELTITEDLINQASYQAEKGTLVMAGSKQRLFSSETQLGGLHIAQGGIKSLEGTFEIQDHLTLEQGILAVPATSKLILMEWAEVEKGGVESFVEGFLYQRGTGQKRYPVGYHNEYAPLILHHIEGEVPTVGVRYEPVNQQPYWEQQSLKGTYHGSAVTLSFNSTQADYLFYGDYLEVLALQEQNLKPESLGSGFREIGENRITIGSAAPTSKRWITVGFAVDPLLEKVYVPNAFSPDASNPEDRCVKVYGEFISSQNFQFGVQDAWGRWIYQTSSLEEAMTQGWPSNGVPASSSQFRYVLTGEFLSGTPIRRSDVVMKF